MSVGNSYVMVGVGGICDVKNVCGGKKHGRKTDRKKCVLRGFLLSFGGFSLSHSFVLPRSDPQLPLTSVCGFSINELEPITVSSIVSAGINVQNCVLRELVQQEMSH